MEVISDKSLDSLMEWYEIKARSAFFQSERKNALSVYKIMAELKQRRENDKKVK